MCRKQYVDGHIYIKKIECVYFLLVHHIKVSIINGANQNGICPFKSITNRKILKMTHKWRAKSWHVAEADDETI